jgi:hypothetical protein
MIEHRTMSARVTLVAFLRPFFRLNTLRCFCHCGVGEPNAVSNAIGYAMPAAVHTML